jgi:hypothetical protein
VLPLAAALAIAALAAPDAPLGVRTPGTFRELFLDATSEDARPPRAPELELRWTAANDWSVPTSLVRNGTTVVVRADEEEQGIRLAMRAPLGRVVAGAEVRLLAHGGGFLDGPIEAWHRATGFTNFERERWPRDGIHVRLGSPGAAPIVAVDGPRTGMGDVVLRAGTVLAEGGASFRSGARWAVSARADVKLPTGSLDRLGGSGAPDGGVALLATAELTPWLTAHALAAGAAWSPLPARSALQPRTWHGTAELSLVALAGGFAFALEDRVVTPAFSGGWQTVAATHREVIAGAGFALLRTHNQITVGVRRGPATVFVSEDFTPGRPGHGTGGWFYSSNEPDLAGGVTLSTAW